MLDIDFDEPATDDEDAFGGLPSPESMNLEKKQNKEIKEKKEEKNHHIKIEIDSVEKLTGALKFATENLNLAVNRVVEEKDLPKILALLEKISKKDYEDFYIDLSKKIDMSKVDDLVEDKINKLDTELSKNNMKIENTSKRYLKSFENITKKFDKYDQTFNDEEIFQTFDRIENIEKFTKNFKFKSIIFSVLTIGILTSGISFFAFKYYFQLKYENEIESLYENRAVTDSTIKTAFDHNLKAIFDENGVIQLHLKPSAIIR